MVDRTHAFAEGNAFPHPMRAEGGLPPLMSQVWTSFLRGADIHETAFLGPGAWCKNLTRVPGRVIIGAESIVRCVLRLEPTTEGSIVIGDQVYIGDDVIISGQAGITIGSRTLIAHGVQIFDNNSHPVDARERALHWKAIREGRRFDAAMVESAPVVIGEDCWLGFNAIIMKGVTIGPRSVVAAGAVVTASVPPDSVVAGNPARVVRTLEPSGPTTDLP